VAAEAVDRVVALGAKQPVEAAGARHQLLHVEGLGQVVVGAGVDPFDPFGPGAARGQDQHRHAASLRPPALQHREPVHAWQPEVEHHQVIVLGVAEKPGLLAVAGGLDVETGGGERCGQVGAYPGVVLDGERAHQSPSSCPTETIRPVAASTMASISRPSGVTSSNS
jgi:D-alanyl-D-alanine carboxypeptidase/D-alanyl-D-alanine-endopeptidase (penicillin-binding protein 4)